MKTKHLTYYIENQRQPVFLIVADVTNKVCYWLFIQEYMKSVNDSGWKSKNKLTLKIPTDNLLNNTEEFKIAVSRSEIYMRDLWPSSVEAAITAQIEHWRSLDPKIEVDIVHKDNKTSYNIRSRNIIDLAFSMDKDKAEYFQRMLDGVTDKGITAHIDGNGIEVKGSNLIKELTKNGGLKELTLKPAAIGNVSLILATVNSQGNFSSVLSNVKGLLFKRQDELVFEGGLENGPLILNFIIPNGGESNQIVLSINMSLEFEKWFNKPVDRLPYRDRLFNLFKDLKSGLQLELDADFEGNFLFKSSSSFDDKEFLISTFSFLELVQKAAKISSYTKTSIILPDEKILKKEDNEIINILYDLILFGQHKSSAAGIKASMELLPNKETFDTIYQNNALGDLRLITYKNFEIFGQNIEFGGLVYEITKAKLLTDITDLNIEEIVKEKRTIKLEWEGTKDSEVIITKSETGE